MNTALNLHRLRPSPPLALSGLLLALGCLLAGSLLPLQAQYESDDFNDGNDAGWTQYNPFAALGAGNLVQWSFTNGGYRIRTTIPSPNNELAGPGRGGSLRSEVYTNFYISVDIVNWNDTLRQAAGILARIRNPGLGTTTGYAFTWDRGNPSSATAGVVDFSHIDGEVPQGITPTGDDRLHLEPGKSYRFVFIGRGPNLEGRVYELPDTTTPKVAVTCSDPNFSPTYEYGANGLVIYDNTTGGTNVCDVTFDNFYVTDIEPPRIKMTNHGFGTWELSWPREASPFVLQSSTVLPGGPLDWTDVPGVQTADDRFWVLVDSDPLLGGLPKLFHRLVRPASGN
jgi:hypothetical protein